jgi:hypothetical protein
MRAFELSPFVFRRYEHLNRAISRSGEGGGEVKTEGKNDRRLAQAEPDCVWSEWLGLKH